MAKWTVALFGHYKPRYELREKKLSKIKQIVAHGYNGEPYYYLASSFTEVGRGYAGSGFHEMTTNINLAGEVKINKVVSRHLEKPVSFDKRRYFLYNVVGWEKRAEPGDIVSFRPYKPNYSPRSQSITITIHGVTRRQMEALCEEYWDLDSYEEYDPMTFIDWYGSVYLKAERASNKREALSLLEENKIQWYDEHFKSVKARCKYPRTYLKKRRFNIPLDDLSNLGVDLVKMQNVNHVYQPRISVKGKKVCFDKMKKRYVNNSDGLNLIRPKNF